ncbi:hypothetical protein BJ912DRAFT_987826 [Pholiota molesta]|nr:hypothetical protein BJ912DRAFT_987826 [Pholiota molesta]
MSSSSGNTPSLLGQLSSARHNSLDSFLKAPNLQLPNLSDDAINLSGHWMPDSGAERNDWYQENNNNPTHAEPFFHDPYAVATCSNTAMGALPNFDANNGESPRTMGNSTPIPDSSGLQSRKMGAHSRRKKVAKFVCSDCRNGFTTGYRLRTHVNRYHTPKELQVRYNCKKCLYSTFFSTDLGRHMNSCRAGAK